MCCFTNSVYAVTQNCLLQIHWHDNWTFWQLACSWGGRKKYGIGQVCFKEKLPSKPKGVISPSLSKAVRTGRTKHRNIAIIKEMKPHLWRDRVQHLSASCRAPGDQSEALRREGEAQTPCTMKRFSTEPKGRGMGGTGYLPPRCLLPAHHWWRRLKGSLWLLFLHSGACPLCKLRWAVQSFQAPTSPAWLPAGLPPAALALPAVAVSSPRCAPWRDAGDAAPWGDAASWGSRDHAGSRQQLF